MAVPANLSDPFLKKWVKPQANPFLLQVCSAVQRALWAAASAVHCWVSNGTVEAAEHNTSLRLSTIAAIIK
jgi:hypothetical protein